MVSPFFSRAREDEMKKAVVTGASSGLGAHIAFALERHDYKIIDWSIEEGVDVTDRKSLNYAAARIEGKIDALINCAGVNHLDWFDDLKESDFDRVLAVNAKGIFLTTQCLLSRLDGGTICNIISNASHVPMTHSFAYNASKGAAHIMTLQMAHELKKTHNITVFGVSPNKLRSTAMTMNVDSRVAALRGISIGEAHAYQLSKLSAGEETDPEKCAELIGFLLSEKERHKYLNGCIIPYGA